MSLLAQQAVRMKGPDTWPSGLRLVALDLADRVNDDDGQAWPSLRDTAERTGLCVRQVRRYLRRLESEGWVVTSARYSHDGGQRSSLVTWLVWVGGLSTGAAGPPLTSVSAPPDMDVRPPPDMDVRPPPDTHVRHNHQYEPPVRTHTEPAARRRSRLGTGPELSTGTQLPLVGVASPPVAGDRQPAAAAPPGAAVDPPPPPPRSRGGRTARRGQSWVGLDEGVARGLA